MWRPISTNAPKAETDRVSALNDYTLAQVAKSDGQKALEDLATTLSRERQEQFLDDLTLQYGYLHPGVCPFPRAVPADRTGRKFLYAAGYGPRHEVR